MLPSLIQFAGVNMFAFNQAVDFPINIASTTQQGACSGLSLHWIKKHKLEQLQTFCASILTPSSIRDVENFQSSIDGFSDAAYIRFNNATGLNQGVEKDISTALTAERISVVLGLTQGYELISFISGGSQHTIALARNGAEVDFFDPNYGCARFNSRDNFRNWFTAEYWNVQSGPGNPGPCTRFMILSLT
ncbi:YopT-type cysteine protease domain-containing protein [uncultured Psychrosphaera sp.]|uniref:YopT-type cysteine protease domain-containing protein n=1 Tax=uncultured Psychrosphaera sp. TaxID=1403522 RepID=UPI002633D31B|nr:YopT-type cysteine protease domain-containing protein [uncultured Psychrosphaera sp.]